MPEDLLVAVRGICYSQVSDLTCPETGLGIEAWCMGCRYNALLDRCTTAEGCDGNCGCVVLSRHEWRDSYSAERMRREQAEAEAKRWYDVVDRAWTACDDTALAEPDETLPLAVTDLRKKLEKAEAKAARLRVRWAQLKTDVAVAALHPDPHGFDNGAAASQLLGRMSALEADQ